jgi:tetratricopeptide (TPR) repeat protein
VVGISIGAERVVHSGRGSYGARRAALAALSVVLCLGGVATGARADEPAELVRERGLAETYRKMLAEDPYQEYALRRLLEVSHSVGGLQGLLKLYGDEVKAAPKRASGWVVLGHMAMAADADGEALQAYQTAAALTPKAPEPWLAIAKLHLRAQRAVEMADAYDRAVALAHAKARKQEVLREAVQSALEMKALDRADAYVAALVATEPNNAYLRMDAAAAFAQAGHPERALAAWLQSAQAAGHELKLLVIIWRHVAELQEQLGDLDGAEATWRGALARMAAGHWAREGYLEGLVGLYRRKDALRVLVAELEPEGRRDPGVRVVVARLLEEVGEDSLALELFRKVVDGRPSDLASRERIIAILERIGTADQVVDAWRALVRASGGESRYELRLVEILFQRGRTKEAFTAMGAMARRYPSDPGVHQSVIDLTMRYGDAAARKRIEREYRVLIALEPREQGHVVSLGEFYWTAGDQGQALSTWKRLLEMGRDEGEGHLLLAEVYADHRMTEEAGAQFEAAVRASPKDMRAAKTYALWLEQQDRQVDALAQWLTVQELAQGGGEGEGRRPADVDEARRHVIGLWERAGRLASETERLEGRFGETPPDLEAGRVLAHAYLRQRRLDDAQRVLERIVRARPDDAEALAGLEEVYTRQNRLPEAIGVLEALARKDPRNAHEFYHRAADLALALGDDVRALELARRAVTGNPADPKAHARVGELYQRMGRLSEAAEALRQSLSLDPRGYPIRFRLAGLYSDLGQPLREEQVLVDIVRESNDQAELLRAGRRLLLVAGRNGRLADVEVVLRPLLQGQGARYETILKLLVDLYAGLASDIAWSPAPEAEREEGSRRLGERALEPLLTALGGPDVALRARALQVVRQTRPRGAVPALARLALEPETTTSFQAAVALGTIGTATAREALGRMLSRPGQDGTDVALWALGMTRAPEATQWLIPALARLQPRALVLSAIALGFSGGPGATEALLPLGRHNHPGVRAAAVWALANIAEPAAVPALSVALRGDEEALARAAAWGLGRVDTPEARESLAAALWDPSARAATMAGEALLARPDRGAPAERLQQAYGAMVDLERGQLETSLAGLLSAGRSTPLAADALAAALADRAAVLRARIATVLTGSDLGALNLFLRSLGSPPGHSGRVGLAPLHLGALPPDAEAVILSWLTPHAERLAAIASGERDPAPRAAAIDLLALLAARGVATASALARDAALAGLRDATADSATRVACLRALALPSAGDAPDPGAVIAALLDRLDSPHPVATPAERAAIATSLGHAPAETATAPLLRLLRDPATTVRLAALAALPQSPPPVLTDPLIDLLDDTVPAVGLAAIEALGRSADPRARSAIAATSTHFDASVRLRARALSP